MKQRRIKLPTGFDRHILREKAMAHGKRMHSHIQRRIPSNGDEIGKHIESRLTASQKVWRNAGIAFFSQKALENISHFSSISLGLLMLVLTDIIMIFPTERRALDIGGLTSKFFAVLAGLLLVNLIVYAAMKSLGSKTRFKVFFSTSNTALFMSIIAVSLPAALVSFALFSTMIRSQAAVSMFFSLIPFYNYLIYGWSAESLARLKGIRSVVVALVALVLMLFLNLILMQF